MKFKFDEEKNRKLIAERGVGFDEIIEAISGGELLKIMDHHNSVKYPNQKVLYTRIENEVYATPCVFGKDETVFMKTVYPSRKARKLLLKKDAR